MKRFTSDAVHFLAREAHFFHHLLPTYKELDKDIRGRFFTDPFLFDQLADAGIDPAPAEEIDGTFAVVASYRDLKLAREHLPYVILSEHGAGQSYAGVASGSYIGSPDRAGTIAVLTPGTEQAARHTATHPTIPAYAVGVPKLDRWHPPRKPPNTGTVAISFHWDCRVCPETRSVLRHYQAVLPRLAERFDMIGHSHPRITQRMRSVYTRAGIEFVEDFDEVIERADVYVCDNSSTIFEFASLDRPVVLMNCPYYRRDVEHGMRFWEKADIGIQVDGHRQLVSGIEQALKDTPQQAKRRRQRVKEIYAATDGKATKRAARAIEAIRKDWI